jgi:hypothetical protein
LQRYRALAVENRGLLRVFAKAQSSGCREQRAVKGIRKGTEGCQEQRAIKGIREGNRGLSRSARATEGQRAVENRGLSRTEGCREQRAVEGIREGTELWLSRTEGCQGYS